MSVPPRIQEIPPRICEVSKSPDVISGAVPPKLPPKRRAIQRGALIASVLAVFTVVMAFAIVGKSMATTPRYVAVATFSINWEQTPIDREKFNSELTNLKVGDQFVALLCQQCKVNTAEIKKQLQDRMRVARVRTEESCDYYQVEFAASKRDVALKAVNLRAQRIVDRFNKQTDEEWSSRAGDSLFESIDAGQKADNLRKEQAVLWQEQNRGYSPARQARIEEIRRELEGAEIKQGFSGLTALVAGVGAFSDAAKVEQSGTLASR